MDEYEEILREADLSMTARTWFPGDDDPDTSPKPHTSPQE